MFEDADFSPSLSRSKYYPLRSLESISHPDILMTSIAMPELTILPSYEGLDNLNVSAMYRRLRDGWWVMDGLDQYFKPRQLYSATNYVPLPDDATINLCYTENTKRIIEDLLIYCYAHNIQIFLIDVPGQGRVGRNAYGEFLAQKYHLPSIKCPSDGLMTFDKVHLTKEHSIIFTERFLREFPASAIEAAYARKGARTGADRLQGSPH